MTVLRCLLVDDEPLALRGLRLRLEKIGGVDIVGEAKNGREAVKLIRSEHPDVVFLDIQMPGLNGFDVVESTPPDGCPLFVFVTAYNEFAVKAFDAHALDYLLKPVDQDRLVSALHTIRDRLTKERATARAQHLEDALRKLGHQPDTLDQSLKMQSSSAQNTAYTTRLNIKDRGRISVVDVHDIEWIDAAGDYMCVHANGETHVMRETMKSLSKQLDPQTFKRVHRSAIVNLNKVKVLEPHSNGECYLVLQSGAEVKVSRSYRAVINHFI
jgi:two-component system LytT family response regulator